MSKWLSISAVQRDDCRENDDYVTAYEYSRTWRYDKNLKGANGKILVPNELNWIVVRINFKNDNNRSSSWDDKSLEMLTPDGWKTIATSKNIPIRVSDKVQDGQKWCRKKSLDHTCENWEADCKQYVENIVKYI